MSKAPFLTAALLAVAFLSCPIHAQDAKKDVAVKPADSPSKVLLNYLERNRPQTHRHRERLPRCVGPGSQGMLWLAVAANCFPLWEGPSGGFKCPFIRERRILCDAP